MPFDEISRNPVSKKIARNNYGGVALCVSAIFATLIIGCDLVSFATNATYGVLGWFVYVGFAALFAIGLTKIFGKKIRMNRRFAVLGGMIIFALFTAIHLAFTHPQLRAGAVFSDYLTEGFSKGNRTPGGLVFALPTYALFAICELEGSLIILAVLFLICASLITTHIVSSGAEKSAVTLVESEFEIEKVNTKKSSDDYKKVSKDLQAALDAKYQDLLQQQSARRMAAGKSQLGLNNLPPKATAGAIHGNPVPLKTLQQEPNAQDQINIWSTDAANTFNAGLGQAFGGQNSLNQQAALPSSGLFGAPSATFNQAQSGYSPSQQFNPSPFGSQTYTSPLPTTPNSFWSNATVPTAPPEATDINQDRLSRKLDRARARSGMSLDDKINARAAASKTDRSRQPELAGVQTSMEIKPQPKPYKPRQYVKPPISLISTESTSLSQFHQDALEKQKILDAKLHEFGVNAKVTGFTVAPAVTRFEIQLASGTRVQQIEQLSKDFSIVLGTSQTRLQLVEGKNAIGIEVPNKTIGMVSIKDILASSEFSQSKNPLTIAIGKNLNDDIVTADISAMPHLLVAGSTGTGKSVCLNTLLVSLMYRAHPDEVKLLLVDPKQVELNQYNDGPHMLVPSAITDVKQAINALKWLETEMRRRYAVLKDNGVNNIGLYHSLPAYKNGTIERMPYIIMVVDEVADLMLQGKKEVEQSIQSLSSLARACGIHLILATQRPSTDIITGVIKTNFVVRMAFQTANRHDSATVINDIGAEKLVGKGDMLYMKESKLNRVQCAFIHLREAIAVMDFIRRNNEAEFDHEIEDIILNGPPAQNNAANGFGDADLARGKAGEDPLFVQILKWLVREENITRTASISSIQRNFNVGFSRAGRIIDQLAEAGYISSEGGKKVRNVLVSKHEVDAAYGE